MRKGARVFYWENSGLQNHRSITEMICAIINSSAIMIIFHRYISVLYVKDSSSGKPRRLLDPNAFDKEGRFSVSNAAITGDGRFVAYTLSENGSDWAVIKVRDVDCGHDLDDMVRYSKLSGIRWTTDYKGFFYQVNC